MKKYIKPSTQFSQLNMCALCAGPASIVGDSPENALAPERGFTGEVQGLKYLI